MLIVLFVTVAVILGRHAAVINEAVIVSQFELGETDRSMATFGLQTVTVLLLDGLGRQLPGLLLGRTADYHWAREEGLAAGLFDGLLPAQVRELILVGDHVMALGLKGLDVAAQVRVGWRWPKAIATKAHRCLEAEHLGGALPAGLATLLEEAVTGLSALVIRRLVTLALSEFLR